MLISYKNVSLSHEDDEEIVLTNVDFQVDEGEFIYIIGKSGAGKSSLLRSIYGEMMIEAADEATVLGRPMVKIKRKEIQNLRKELGIIFQDFKLLNHRSVKWNLEFVLKATGWKKKEDIAQRITEVLKSVGMEGMEDKMPHELSGGEQQRVAIARSLLNSPKMILADEPTGNLDAETADTIIALFQEISKTGTTVIMTTHNMGIVEKFPGKVYQCEEQKLIPIEKETKDNNK